MSMTTKERAKRGFYICEYCKTKVGPEDKFCKNCGIEIVPLRDKRSTKGLPDLMRKKGGGLYELEEYGLYENAGETWIPKRRKTAKTYEELIALGFKPDNKPGKLPKYMAKKYTYKGKQYESVYELTRYGSYIDLSISDGMVQARNAKSYKWLVKNGYKPSNTR